MKKILPLLIFLCSITISAQEIKFENTYGLPIVKVKIGNNVDKLFVIDSGATFSCINKNYIYDGYRIKYIKNSFNLVGFADASIDNYKLIDTYINDSIQSQFIAVDLSSFIETMDKHGFKIYGIIGSDFLCNHRCIIDYNTRTLIIKQ